MPILYQISSPASPCCYAFHSVQGRRYDSRPFPAGVSGTILKGCAVSDQPKERHGSEEQDGLHVSLPIEAFKAVLPFLVAMLLIAWQVIG